MYPDDSLTLHTDLYQINMMQVTLTKGFTIRRRSLRCISANSLLRTAMRFLQVWKEL
ncbi:Nicotinate phosphoribosyltransferase [Streptococcus pneumoniae]|nr:Nicotinate phosphoribosyltransferase [Streptococcus pneumoniae]